MPSSSRIRTRFTRPDTALVAAYAEVSTCDIADVVGRTCVMDPAIRHFGGGKRLAGTALTVGVDPGDHLMVVAALDRARPGDVITVCAGGNTSNALVGEMLTAWARQIGVSGFVVDGAVRDVDDLYVPTFARDRCAVRPGKSRGGEMGWPISLGGVIVHPGDIVVADVNGVAVVPQDRAEAVLREAQTIAARDQAMRAAIHAGTWAFDRSWISATLRKAGVEEGSEA